MNFGPTANTNPGLRVSNVCIDRRGCRRTGYGRLLLAPGMEVPYRLAGLPPDIRHYMLPALP